MPGFGKRFVAGADEAVPADSDDARPAQARNLLRPVRGARVRDDDLVRERDRLEGRWQAILLVLGEDHDRERRAHHRDISRALSCSPVRLLALDLGPAMRGGQQQSLHLLAGLAAHGHEIRLLAPRGAPLAPAARSRGLDVVEMPPGSEASPSLLLAVAREARSFRPEIVYAGDARGHGAAVFSRAITAAPLVVHRRVVFPPRRDPFSRLKYRSVARYVAVSRATAESLERAGVPAAKVIVVPDGLPDEAFLESAAPAPPPFRFVHVGAFDGMKGQDVVVETLARLVAGGFDATVLFLGDGPRRVSVEAQAASRGVAGRCVFAGHIEDVASHSPHPTSSSSLRAARAGPSRSSRPWLRAASRSGTTWAARRRWCRGGRPELSSHPSTRRHGSGQCSRSSATPSAASA